MADFLDNLLDRAVGAAPVLERRRASVYEPETPRSGTEEGLAQENIFAETPSRRRAESSSIGVPQSPTRRVEHREEQAALPSFRAHDESSRDMPRVEIRSVINDVPPAFPGLHRNFAVDSPIQQPIVVHNSVIERQTERVITMKHEIVHDMQGELRHVTIAGAPAETPRVPPSASDRVVPLRPAASVAPVTSNLSKPDSRSVPAAPMFEHRGRPASLSMAKENPLPEPVPAPIQVTIGRIEVRASHAPAPAPVRASRTPDPKLSLNDYLASRRKDAQ